MITTANYYTEIKNIQKNILPDTLLKGWAFVDKVTDKGSSWDAYNQSESIKKTVDLYLTKLNEFLGSQKPEPKKAAKPRATSTRAASPKPKTTTRRSTSKPKSKTARQLAY
ncbi:MAG: hypothetical protein R2780_15755, partial [Crocinitomicaceae bacterium]